MKPNRLSKANEILMHAIKIWIIIKVKIPVFFSFKKQKSEKKHEIQKCGLSFNYWNFLEGFVILFINTSNYNVHFMKKVLAIYSSLEIK